MSIQYLLECSANKLVLKLKAIDQGIIKTNNTIMVKETSCDEHIKVCLSKCRIPHVEPSVQTDRSMMANHKGRKDDVKSSLDDEEEETEKRI